MCLCFPQLQVGCRMLSILKIYFTSTSYLWMSVEGYYLHRLISHPFDPPKSLVPYFLIGWRKYIVFPLITCSSSYFNTWQQAVNARYKLITSVTIDYKSRDHWITWTCTLCLICHEPRGTCLAYGCSADKRK